jgi:hypothetical protein
VPTHESQLERSISRLVQTNYATPRTSGDDYRRIISASRSILAAKTNFVDDGGYDNGSDVPSEKWAETSSVDGPMNPMYNFQDAGYFWLWALGGYSVSGPDGGLYTHVFTPQNMNTSRQLPVRTVLEKWGGLNLRMLPSVYCSQYDTSGGKSGRLAQSLTLVGSGAYTDNPGGYVSPPIVSDREYGYGGQASFRLDNKTGTKQVDTATAVRTASGSGNITVTFTAAGLAGSPIAVPVAILIGDTPSVWAAKVRTALRANAVISAAYDISGAAASIIATARVAAANDATLNIAIAAGATGVTAAPTSADTTAGVVGSYQPYACEIENWTVSVKNPLARDGYRQCAPYVIAGIPESGTTRSEALVGARSLSLDFNVTLEAGDKMRGWLLNGTPLRFEHTIVGKEVNDFSQRILHTNARVTDAVESPSGAEGGFFAINGTVDLMSDPTVSSGYIPFSVTLVNNVVSYTT